MNEIKLKDLFVLFLYRFFLLLQLLQVLQNFCVRRMTIPVIIISGQNIVKFLAIDLCHHITITALELMYVHNLWNILNWMFSFMFTLHCAQKWNLLYLYFLCMNFMFLMLTYTRKIVWNFLFCCSHSRRQKVE